MPELTLLIPPALVLAATCLPTYRWRRAGLAAVLVVQLALASLELTGGLGPLRSALSPGYLAVSAALLLGGILLAIGALVGAWRSGKGERPTLLTAAAVLLGVTVFMLRLTLPLATDGGVWRTLGALAGILAGGTLLVLLVGARRTRATIGKLGRLRPSVPGTPPAPSPRTRSLVLALHLVGVLLSLVAPSLPLLVIGVVMAVLAGARWEYLAGQGRPWPGGVGVVLVALVAGAGWTVATAGGTSLMLSAMSDGPYSSAFQVAVLPLLILAAWPLLRLWPLHLTRTGPAAALAGGALLLLFAVPVFPDGVTHWQPVLYLLLALGAWYGALSRNDSLLAESLAAAGLLSGVTEAGWGAIALLTGAIVVQSLARATRTVPVALIAGRTLLVLSSVAVVPLLVGALQAEVFSTALLVAGAVVGLLSAEDRRRVDRGPSLV